ncbi:RHS repeat domain-containing protein [Hugenholtzia roseola]|uniref:RHS repeat domain-containing protein n=1 Tax=Hugenholtzia roseola TaxID=1002 RepID=UPI000401AD57|nr:RHS repeat-associated core domain-containing protein [Hugenholtzia roseola]
MLNKNFWQYNGKEKETFLGLHLTDYGWRQQDPQLCRFWGINPLAEKYYSLTPFAYVANNPINAIDPDGREITYTFSEDMTGEEKMEFLQGLSKLYEDSNTFQTMFDDLASSKHEHKIQIFGYNSKDVNNREHTTNPDDKIGRGSQMNLGLGGSPVVRSVPITKE